MTHCFILSGGLQIVALAVDIQEKTPSGTAQTVTPSDQAVTPQLSELDSQLINGAVNESESTEDAVTVSVEGAEDVDPLDKFLPPPPTARCSDELQVSSKLDFSN